MTRLLRRMVEEGNGIVSALHASKERCMQPNMNIGPGGGERRGSSPQYFRLWIVDITHICPQYFKAQPRWHADASSFRLNKASTLGHKCWRFNIDPLTLLQRIGITKYPKHVLISLKPFGKYKIIHVQHLLSNKHWVLIGWV